MGLRSISRGHHERGVVASSKESTGGGPPREGVRRGSCCARDGDERGEGAG